jgi:hypothetical protein
MCRRVSVEMNPQTASEMNLFAFKVKMNQFAFMVILKLVDLIEKMHLLSNESEKGRQGLRFKV